MVKAEKAFDKVDESIEGAAHKFGMACKSRWAKISAWWAEQKRQWQDLNKQEYRMVEYINQLTDERYWFIEGRKGSASDWEIEKISENPVYQQSLGCDKDGMFGDANKCRHVLKFLRGELKVIKRVIE